MRQWNNLYSLKTFRYAIAVVFPLLFRLLFCLTLNSSLTSHTDPYNNLIILLSNIRKEKDCEEFNKKANKMKTTIQFFLLFYFTNSMRNIWHIKRLYCVVYYYLTGEKDSSKKIPMLWNSGSQKRAKKYIIW